MNSEETSEHVSRPGNGWVWLLGGCALSITTFCSLISSGLLLASMALNSYLAWTLSGYEINISRPTSRATTVVEITPPSAPVIVSNTTPTTAPTNTPAPTPTAAPSHTARPDPTTAPSETPTPTPTTAPADTPTPAPTAAPTHTPTTAAAVVPASSPGPSATQSTLEVEFVTRTGTATQLAEMETAETEAGRSPNDAPMAITSDSSQAVGVATPETQSTYVVQPGDTLWLIAVKAYGRGSMWQLIFEANGDVLEDPSRIWPEQVLKIPPEP